MAAGQAAQDMRAPVGPARLLGALWRARWIMLACGILAAVLGFVGARSLPREYTADATLALETQTFRIPELQGAVTGETGADPMPWVRTEVQVLRSRSLLGVVAEELRLEEDADLNPALHHPTLSSRIRAAIMNVIPGGPPPLPPSGDPAARRLQGVVDEMNRRLGVVHDNRSLVIGLTFTAADPARAAEVLNALMRRYIAARTEARTETNREANTSLTGRVQEIRGELEGVQRRIQQVRTENNLVDLRAGSVTQQQLEDLAAAAARAGAERSELEARRNSAAQIARTGALPTDNASVIASETISRLRDREAEAARRAAEADARFGPRHPDVRSAQAELGSVRAQITAEARRVVGALDAQLAAARAREQGIGRELAEAQQVAVRTASARATLNELEREAEGLRGLYRTLQERAVQTASDSVGGAQIPGARIVSTAVPPEAPSSPRVLLTSGIGLIAGVALGGVLGLLRKGDVQPFAEDDDVQGETGLPVLGRIVARRGAKLPQRVIEDPSGPEAEALRALRGRLRFTGRHRVPRIVLFVSSTADEGASDTAAAFARVAAMDGVRTLLVNGDLQGAALGRMLGEVRHDGLAGALRGEAAWRDLVMTDAPTRLDLLLAANPQPEAARLLEGMRLQNILADALEDYNLVVLDGPPATTAAGAMALAHRADAVLLVVRGDRTPRGMVARAVERLGGAARNLAGVVLVRRG